MNKDILYEAINSLQKQVDIKVNIIDFEYYEIHHQHRIDARIELNYHRNISMFNTEIRTKVLPAQLPRLIEHFFTIKNPLLIAEYITPKSKRYLKDNKISYIDGVGNAFINGENLFLYIETNRKKPLKIQHNSRAFSRTGLKVIYHFLLNASLINQPYRFIGEQIGVSIDTISKVLKDLVEHKYLLKSSDKQYSFSRKEALFLEWVTVFNKTLRPKLKQKRYRLLKNSSNSLIDIQLPNKTLWGGEVAAELSEQHLIAQSGIIYTNLAFVDVMKVAKLIPDNTGNILLMEAFWTIKDTKVSKLVHPFLIYADLVHNTNPRNIETAKKIFTEYVKATL